MISWLNGLIIQTWHHSSKHGVVIDVSGIGYEVQLLSKQLNLVHNSTKQEIWIHQVNRDDYTNLYGFTDINQTYFFQRFYRMEIIVSRRGM